jgi:hypothetical protein
MKWFRSGLPPHQTALAMIGARAGDAVVFLGADRAALAAEVGRVTGLNGRTVVIDRGDAARARIDRAAAAAGALVEFTDADVAAAIPAETGTFDAAVIACGLSARTDADRRSCCAHALALARPGGRVIVMEGRPEGRLAHARGAPTRLSAAEIGALLEACGARAARRLADAGGVTYDEARKPRA